jgi:hypothetical protein
MAREFTLQEALLAVLYDHPAGLDPTALVHKLMAKGVPIAEIDNGLQPALEEHQSRGNVYQEARNDCVWNLTARCRQHLNESLPEAQQRVQATKPPSKN